MNRLQHYYQGKYPELVMFDLDGTLVDSVPDIAIAVNKALIALDLPVVSEENVRIWVGNGADVLTRRALTAGDDQKNIDQGIWDKAYKLLLDYYPYHHDEKYVYDGVVPFLEEMYRSNVKMAIVTNKPIAFVEPLLKEVDIAHYFQWFIGAGSIPQKKPAPEPLLHVLAQANVTACNALFVGDSRNDVRAAQAAHVPCAALTYGYNHGEPIVNEKPTWVVDSLTDLLKVFAE